MSVYVCLRLCLDAVNYVRRVLVEITASLGQQNVDELLRQAEQMMTDIRRRDFSERTQQVHGELARAIEGLSVRSFLSLLLCAVFRLI